MKKQIIKNFRLDYSEYTGLECTAPCSLYSVLLDHSLIKNPYYGENMGLIRDLSKTGSVFYTTFHLSNEEFIQSNILLRFNGLDALCRIVLNGEELGKTDNIHRTYTFDVKSRVVYGENTLRLEFTPTADSPMRRAAFMQECGGALSLVDMGISREIELISFSHKIIDDLIVRQVHNEDGSVRVNLEITTIGLDSMSRAVANLVSPGGQSYYCGLIGGKGSILLKNPNLWWPNGLGVQNLYRLSVNLYSDSELEDSRDIRIGLRTLTTSSSDDEEGGEELALVVNGVKFFTMGARYIPEDCILPKISKERTRKILEGCKAANFNSLSVWGGGVYPPDYFYDLCDELGLVVWQEVMDSDATYNTEEYKDSIKEELCDNFSRIAHHPSLGVVLGSAEIEELTAKSEEGSAEGENNSPTDTEDLVFSLAKEIIPDTVYLSSSAVLCGGFNSTLSRDNMSTLSQYGIPESESNKTDLGYIREAGVESLPSYKTTCTFASADDLNLFSPTMEAHQSAGDTNERMICSVARQYRYACDFDSLIYATQLVSGDVIRANVEYARRHRGEYMGYMFGQLNDCFPVSSHSSIDYYGRWKALHYYAKRFYSPVLVSAAKEGTRVRFNLSNEQRIVYNGRFSYSLLDNKNNCIFTDSFDISMDASSTLDLPMVDFTDKLKGHEREYYLAYSITGNTASSSGTMLFVPPKSFDFLPPKIDAEIDGNLRDYTITLCTDAYARGVEIDFAEVDAVFEDNYFDLTSCSSHRIHFTTREVTTPETLRRELRIKTVYNIGN